MKELFEILKSHNCINDIPIDDLINVFINEDNSQYAIAMVGKGKLVLKNKQDNKFEKFDCINNYFNISDATECSEICKSVGSDKMYCDKCFACALKKLNTGELNLK